MDKFKLVFVMFLWGSIGVFTRYISIEPILLSFLRSIIALPVIYIFFKIENKKPLSKVISFKGALPFIMSGVLLAFGWLFLFLAYEKTSISISVLVYNLAPIYVLLLAPTVLKEKLSILQIACILFAFIGLGLIVSGALNESDFSISGLMCALCSGIIYASIILLNRKTKSTYSTTTIILIQLISSSIILFPFAILGKNIDIAQFNITTIALIIILGIIHTGLAYHMYFSVYKTLPASSIATIGYLEPVFGILLSALLLNEIMQVNQIVGGFLILISTYIAERYKVKNINPVRSQ